MSIALAGKNVFSLLGRAVALVLQLQKCASPLEWNALSPQEEKVN